MSRARPIAVLRAPLPMALPATRPTLEWAEPPAPRPPGFMAPARGGGNVLAAGTRLAALSLVWMLRRVVGRLRRKGLWFFIAWFALVQVNGLMPWAGTALAPTVMTLLPPMALWLWLRLEIHTVGSSVRSFLFAALGMLASGALGLLKAWSAAAGASTLHAWAGKLAIILLGFLPSLGLSFLTLPFGWDAVSPIQLRHPGGVWANLVGLDPLLITASLAVIGLALRQLYWALREWGGQNPPIPEAYKPYRRNKVLNDRAAHRVLRRRRKHRSN